MVRLRISYDAMTNLLRRCYGVIGPIYSSFTVSIDGSAPRLFSGKNNVVLAQKLLWSNTTLGPGRHTVTLTRDDSAKDQFNLDFFRYVVSGVRVDTVA